MKESTSTGVGFSTLLALVFIALKLTGHIDWSWWWVLAPLWVFPAIVIAVIVLFFFIKIVWVTFSK
jgi:hypothetical protein